MLGGNGEALWHSEFKFGLIHRDLLPGIGIPDFDLAIPGDEAKVLGDLPGGVLTSFE